MMKCSEPSQKKVTAKPNNISATSTPLNNPYSIFYTMTFPALKAWKYLNDPNIDKP